MLACSGLKKQKGPRTWGGLESPSLQRNITKITVWSKFLLPQFCYDSTYLGLFTVKTMISPPRLSYCTKRADLKPDNKPRRSEYVNTSNFTFPSSNTALGASFEVLWLASRCMVFQKHSPREALRATSKLAPNAAFELGKLKFKVCTYLERRCLLYGCKISSFDDILKRPRKL